MPRVVDRDGRREEIVAAAGRVIARDGIEATTVRRIAAEAGYSSGVLDHYFHGKDEILLEALRASHTGIHTRLRTLLAGLRGLAALRAMLLDNVPVDDMRRDETRLEMQFWARSLGDPSLAEVQVRESGVFRRAIERYLREAVADGELSPDLDATGEAERLLALVDGASMHATVDPTRMPPAVLTALLDRALAELAR